MTKKIKTPELLCPAGNLEKLRAAVDYGADAVYFAGKLFGMRAAADNFTHDEIKEGVAYAHSKGKRAYLTVNVMPHGDEYGRLSEYIKEIRDCEIDAVIVADLGVIELFKREAPETEIHISTQANCVSAPACAAYAALGAKRIVLARELSLEEIKAIRAALPESVELEAFVHGSMCVSVSGRCLLSNNFTGRDANRGACTQPCRWEYTITEIKRPNEPLPIEEVKGQNGGTFIMSSKDMCMIEHIPELVKSGVDSLKVEGRMKSAYYTAVVANAYRMALDRYAENPEGYAFEPAWMRELCSVSHREYCTGFFFDDPMKNAQTVTENGYIREKAYLAAAVSDSDGEGFVTFVQRNKFSVGDEVELITPGKCGRGFTAEAIFLPDGEPVESVPHPMMEFRMKVPFAVKCGDILRQK